MSHLRDLRSELLLKIALAERCGVDIVPMLDAQRERLDEQVATLSATALDPSGRVVDPVALWRYEVACAGQRFLAQLRD